MRLQEKDPELYQWLEAATADNEKVVYIGLGTVARWRQWSVDVFYDGLNQLGCKVVWSLRTYKAPEAAYSNPKFWIKDWIPQIEVLHHPAVKAGMTHCGFGGTLEFI